MIGQTISHYKIFEKIGEGGMGVVYKAEDTKLRRTVAIKFLPPELTQDDQAKQRFLHEAQAASALDHPNVCTIFEIDETPEGRLFIVMAYYDGESLRNKIQRGPVPIEEAVRIADQIADGLKEAHEKGIVHRDIKPENILLTARGKATVMDFGLARMRGGTAITRPGTMVGTVAYMSPEQIRGEPVDHRTDLWSLGAVLYEMLTTYRPFRADNEAALIYLILNADVTPPTAFQPEIPTNLEQAIVNMLAKDRDLRLATANEFQSAITNSPDRAQNQAEHTDEMSILVLPFEDLSPEQDSAYFADGLTEELITDLSRIGPLRVISRSSAMKLRGSQHDTRTIAARLNVQYLLEGSVRKAGGRLRITSRLVDAQRDSQVWAEHYTGVLGDVFSLQTQVSQDIVEALKLKLSTVERQQLISREVSNVTAYEYLLRARRELWRYNASASRGAIRYLEAGLKIAGENAALYAGLAYAYWHQVNMGLGQEEEIDKAEELAQKALEIDPNLPLGHLVLGQVSGAFRGDQRSRIGHLKRALEIEPNNVDCLYWLCHTYALVGNLTATETIPERILLVDPLTPIGHIVSAEIAFMGGRFNHAIEACRVAWGLEPDNAAIRMHYAFALVYGGRLAETDPLMAMSEGASPKLDFDRLLLFLLYARNGERSRAEMQIDKAVTKTSRRDLEYSWRIAAGYALLGMHDEALDWLENAVKCGFVNYPFLSSCDTSFESLREDGRFRRLMVKVKEEWEMFCKLP
ncbi:MAG: protein kinase [Candidatus Eisenbacteria bacterium]